MQNLADKAHAKGDEFIPKRYKEDIKDDINRRSYHPLMRFGLFLIFAFLFPFTMEAQVEMIEYPTHKSAREALTNNNTGPSIQTTLPCKDSVHYIGDNLFGLTNVPLTADKIIIEVDTVRDIWLSAKEYDIREGTTLFSNVRLDIGGCPEDAFISLASMVGSGQVLGSAWRVQTSFDCLDDELTNWYTSTDGINFTFHNQDDLFYHTNGEFFYATNICNGNLIISDTITPCELVNVSQYYDGTSLRTYATNSSTCTVDSVQWVVNGVKEAGTINRVIPLTDGDLIVCELYCRAEQCATPAVFYYNKDTSIFKITLNTSETIDYWDGGPNFEGVLTARNAANDEVVVEQWFYKDTGYPVFGYAGGGSYFPTKAKKYCWGSYYATAEIDGILYHSNIVDNTCVGP